MYTLYHGTACLTLRLLLCDLPPALTLFLPVRSGKDNWSYLLRHDELLTSPTCDELARVYLAARERKCSAPHLTAAHQTQQRATAECALAWLWL